MKILKEDAQSVGNILLEIGALLMSSGASTNRTRITMGRIAKGLGYGIELLITQRALMLTIIEKDHQHFFSRMKRISPHGVNFRIVSGISHLSWNVMEQNWTVAQIAEELHRLKSLPHYPRPIILGAVGLAGAGFCNIFGGGYIEMTVAFVATVAGLFIRQEAIKKKFNPYLCVFFAAFTASFIAGLAEHYHIGMQPDKAFATSVLFLVPGVPLINSVTDLVDGNIQNGMVRAMNGLMIAFSIAMGILAVKMILNF
ncbi:MAG: threonine/serine exporter family protein [Verrucomicrobia bacterium]|nr:threonine/serine exporter family protein [Prolixibacteraceae bacterium]